jgi:protein-disulfide isomerase
MRALIFSLALALPLSISTIVNATEVDASQSTSVPVAPSAESVATGLSIDQIRAIVRDEIRKNPKLILDAVNEYASQQQKDQQVEASKNTLANKALIEDQDGYPVLGDANGKATVYYFFDYNCHFCKKLEPELARFMSDNPDVKLVFRNMPILAPSSHYAAEVAGVFAVMYPEKYGELHDALMKIDPGMSNNDIDRAVVSVVGQEKAAAVIQKATQPDSDDVAKAVAKRIEKTLDTARKAAISGTPFVFVAGSDGMLRGASDTAYDDLTKMVKDARVLAANPRK